MKGEVLLQLAAALRLLPYILGMIIAATRNYPWLLAALLFAALSTGYRVFVGTPLDANVSLLIASGFALSIFMHAFRLPKREIKE